jgi:Straboviridae dCMP hydroxymethylase
MNGMYRDNRVVEVREQFASLLLREDFVVDKSGVRLLEIPGASFLADEETIFDEVNYDYVVREIDWYNSQSLNVNDIPGGPPAIWKQVATPQGLINSNYGALIFSGWNGNQYKNVLEELRRAPTSRRSTMIYTRPSMWTDYNEGGRSDFICTNAVGYLLRDGFLDVVVQMRSNDVRFGYRNDRYWAQYVQSKLAADLSVQPGDIYWQVTSLHIYEKDFFLVDHYAKSTDHTIKKSEYRELYPDSEWAK